MCNYILPFLRNKFLNDLIKIKIKSKYCTSTSLQRAAYYESTLCIFTTSCSYLLEYAAISTVITSLKILYSYLSLLRDLHEASRYQLELMTLAL